MFDLPKPPTPIPSPPRGRGGAFCATVRGVPDGSPGRLPPPTVGEGRGGGAIPEGKGRAA